MDLDKTSFWCHELKTTAENIYLNFYSFDIWDSKAKQIMHCSVADGNMFQTRQCSPIEKAPLFTPLLPLNWAIDCI